jgi:signal transduction histidine kinase
MQQATLNNSNKKKFDPFKSRTFMYLFSGIMMAGYLMDVVFIDFPTPVYYLNFVNILISLVVLVLFFAEKIEIRNVVKVNILGLLANLLLSFMFNPPDAVDYTGMFLRNAFIMFMFIPVYGLYCGKNSVFHIGVVFLILFVAVLLRANNQFLINNAPILIFGTVLYHLSFYYLFDALERMGKKQVELNRHLESQKDELLIKNNDLELKNRQIIEQAKELSQTLATKDKLFSIIAHDLRSPFNSIIGLSDLLVANIEEYDKAKILKFAELINTSAKPTLAILDNLLNWAKSQTGQLHYHPERMQLGLLYQEVENVINSLASFKNITLINSLSRDIEVFADKNMIKSVLFNLVSNAIKFTKPEGKVIIDARQMEDRIEISISDSGVGMSDERKSRLFNTETPETTHGTAREPGSGLGLILCKEFVEKHRGTIWVESIEGQGSTFTFTLPMAPKFKSGLTASLHQGGTCTAV